MMQDVCEGGFVGSEDRGPVKLLLGLAEPGLNHALRQRCLCANALDLGDQVLLIVGLEKQTVAFVVDHARNPP